jgi:hypothetical protein
MENVSDKPPGYPGLPSAPPTNFHQQVGPQPQDCKLNEYQ